MKTCPSSAPSSFAASRVLFCLSLEYFTLRDGTNMILHVVLEQTANEMKAELAYCAFYDRGHNAHALAEPTQVVAEPEEDSLAI
ncbi:hypothetical protein Tco_0266962 [Tanacetum coccineum]